MQNWKDAADLRRNRCSWWRWKNCPPTPECPAHRSSSADCRQAAWIIIMLIVILSSSSSSSSLTQIIQSCRAFLVSKAPSTPATMSKQQATLSKLRSTLAKQHSTLLPQTAIMSNEYRQISSFRQSWVLRRHCCRFWQQCCRFRQQCRTKFRPLDKVETNWTCSIFFDFVERKDENSFDMVAKNGNNVEATFDFVERMIFCVQIVAWNFETRQNLGEGQFTLVSPTPNSGCLVPRPFMIYAHAQTASRSVQPVLQGTSSWPTHRHDHAV